MYKVTIPMKLPDLNEFLTVCKGNKYAANKMKQDCEDDIVWFLKKLPKFEKPIRLSFTWVSEPTDRRDPDNICFAKKFILDALQKAGKLKNDNRKYVNGGFTDGFMIGNRYEVIVKIEELKSFEMEEK